MGKQRPEGELYMEWISVKDKLPEPQEFVLAYNGSKIFVASRFHLGHEEYFSPSICTCCESDEHEYHHAITYWMPLPEIPKD